VVVFIDDHRGWPSRDSGWTHHVGAFSLNSLNSLNSFDSFDSFDSFFSLVNVN
jgi:hypothetical protein